jgi:nucleolar pre-ribosomal-associated protein 1
VYTERYWTAANLTLEPRLSTKWLTNIAIFGSIVMLPIPSGCFVLHTHKPYPDAERFKASGVNGRVYNPRPPPLHSILQSFLPSAPSLNTKHIFTKGLQSSSTLVQHCVSLALAKCLMKYWRVTQEMRLVEKALGECSIATTDDGAPDTSAGQWCRRRQELEMEVRKRLPDFQVVVAFSQKVEKPHKNQAKSNEETSSTKSQAPIAPVNMNLLGEAAQRVLWLYHHALPTLAGEARFDVGKLLGSVYVGGNIREAEGSGNGVQTLEKLHVLRLLLESEQFSWQTKSGTYWITFFLYSLIEVRVPGTRTNLSILLNKYAETSKPVIRVAIQGILRRTFKDSIFFAHNPNEINIWLDALPMTRRAPSAQAPDGTPLTDEGAGVATFLDECFQRCARAPYVYHKMLVNSQKEIIGSGEPLALDTSSTPVSPLIVTLMEQLAIRIEKQLFSRSDLLAVMAYIRHILLLLVGNGLPLALVEEYTNQISHLLENAGQSFSGPAFSREIRFTRNLVHQIQGSATSVLHPGNNVAGRDINMFLNQVDSLPISKPLANQGLYKQLKAPF